MAASDEALLQSHLQGDHTAFGELLRRHSDSLWGYLLRMCPSRQMAEDIFQETFRRVHEKAHTFQGKSRFKTWLYAIAYHTAIDGIRKYQRECRMVSLSKQNDCDDSGHPAKAILLADETRDPYETAVRAEQKKQVKQALEKLPPRQRAVLVLVYYQQLTYREAAETLGCSLGTVKSQMFRALKALAELLPDLQGGVE